MSVQAALRVSPASASSDESGGASAGGRYALVERSFEEFSAALEVALGGFGEGDGPRLHDGVGAAIGVVARLRDCLDYEATPVLAAYLNSMFDYVLSQLITSRATRDLQSLGNAGYVMAELQKMFAAAHRRAGRDERDEL
jgi:flagellin-specific chaperone FliS